MSYEYSKSDEYIKFWEKLKKGKFFDGIFERRKVDGSIIYLQASYNPVVDSKGNITDVVKIATDVTEAVNDKKKIDQLSKNLTVELENSQKLKDSIEKEKDAALNDLDVIIKKGKYFDGIFERRKVDGSIIYLQASYNPILDSKGNITAVVKIATDVTESVINKKKIDTLSQNLQIELDNSQKLKNAIELEKDAALNDLDMMMKKSQSELIKVIVKVALAVIVGVGLVTTALYWMAIVTNQDTQIIGSTWSNMFSVLLTNAFSIVGTIMGIKYATQETKK